ncbi:MAG: hypothetical protein Q7J06_02790 [Bacteroidales bacterium]|nr:hypothetical protein [Bacteroidales bacterium]
MWSLFGWTEWSLFGWPRARTIKATNQQYKTAGSSISATNIAGYNAVVSSFNSFPWTDGAYVQQVGAYGIGAHLDNYASPPWNIDRGRGQILLDWTPTNIPANSYQIYIRLTDKTYQYGSICHYIVDEDMGTNENYMLVDFLDGDTELPYTSFVIGDNSSAVTLGPYFPSVFMLDWEVRRPLVITDWQFNYCTNSI